jgi:hypothetical protein
VRRSGRPSPFLCIASSLAALLASCSQAGGGPSPWTGGSAGTRAIQEQADDGREAGTARPAISVLAGTALLIRGSERVRGLPFLGQNALDALTGSYALRDADGSIMELDLWYCAEPLIIPADWGRRACPGLPPAFALRAAPQAPALGGIRDGHEVLVLETESYRLFVSLPIGFGAACRFAAALSERFDWFRRYAALPSDLSFPALLEYSP